MSNSTDSKIPRLLEQTPKKRLAYALSRGVFVKDDCRFTVIDDALRILGGVDSATITFARDPRAEHSHLFVSDFFGALFDIQTGPDSSYLARLEALASLALDVPHALRALGLDDGGER